MNNKNHIINRKIILFTRQINDVLGISVPKITINPSEMKTKAQLAATIVGGIVLRSNNFTPETALAIAHELRHLWQLELHEEEYFKAGSVDTQDYNMQKAEIDANAFASVIMTVLFGMKPTFENLSSQINKQIEKRIVEIEDDICKSIEQIEM